jgi:glutathione S-transferase
VGDVPQPEGGVVMLKIYGSPMSTCTRKVLMTLAENETPFEMNVVDFMKGEHKLEANLRRQPFGRMPSLDDDGFEMFESRAMCRYLNEKYRGHLIPTDVHARAKMEQWISVETSEFTDHAMKFIYNFVFHRAQDAAVMERAEQGLAATCTVMQAQLAKTPFLAGSDFTLADIVYMPYLEYAMQTPAKEIVGKYPHVTSWWNKISERPTWRKVAGKG